MNASDKFEKLLEQYIEVLPDGTLRLKGVRQPRFSDLMKLASIVQNIRAQRDANAPQSSFASHSDEQLVEELAAMLCHLDDATFERVLRAVADRKGLAFSVARSQASQPDPQPVQPSSTVEGAREEREPTEGEERYSVARSVQHVSSDEDTSPAADPPPPVSRNASTKQGASARARAAARGASGSSARSEQSARDGAPTLSPTTSGRKAKE